MEKDDLFKNNLNLIQSSLLYNNFSIFTYFYIQMQNFKKYVNNVLRKNIVRNIMKK